MKVSFADIQKARELLKDIICPTEMSHSISASNLLKSEVYLKFENTQRTGSFKFRGAYNKISNLTADEKARGVVASSAGNHAQGVALSAKLAGVKSTIVMPETASISKASATRDYGANVVLKGEIYDEAFEHAQKLEKEHGYTFVHPYQDPYVIAGQGTIGIEILEKVPDLDTVIVPIGGGGLISGVALAVKAINPKIRVIGVQSDRSPGMAHLYNKQPLSQVKRAATIADGIAIKNPSQVMLDSFISKYVDQVVTVSDDEIAEAIVFLMERAKTVAEGSGAAAMAAAMSRGLDLGKKTCVIISGGNIDLNIVSKIIDRGQILRGRLCELSVIVDDLPGNLSRLTQAIASQKANILEVRHDRVSKGLSLRETRIDFVLETTSIEHVERIKRALEETGAKVIQST
ncbi:L-threonine ammonia-lyase [Bdellovibrio bacteriovorus]|uniref:threonine ammonia-lyase n=1 Tax=Bdellovibrio bacteriovorus TaxID=959 RepID=UPI00045BF9BF|nr:threonine ammonia-lyase [Bdellovibrio bacteriovorus]AHZ86299.1 threonine dehydratase [Bdellovibrio bacteriovorus]BEV67537.1 L-threonine ammonia-lyase [Bdellovibrio bacteriovorus]